MTFTLTGPVGAESVSVTWDDGAVTGNATVRSRALAAVASRRWIAQTPTGPTYRAALKPAHVALVTLADGFDGPVEATGDVPDLPGTAIPAGAVA